MKIAIQGHPTRGKEVIQILESLGGVNIIEYKGCEEDWWYYICPDDNSILHGDKEDLDEFKLYTLKEFEKEFPFKIGDKVTIIGLPDFPKVITQMAWDCDEILYSFEGLVSTWYGAKALRRFKMKEERNITLTLDKAKEWYKKGGELKEVALQAYSEEELTKIELPKTWEEFCENYPVKVGETWVGSYDTIYSATMIQSRIYKNWIPSRRSAEAHLALIQLEQLRDCWRQGWEPEYNEHHKYAIKNVNGKLTVILATRISAFLIFPTREVAEEFLKCFRDLIEKAGDLI